MENISQTIFNELEKDLFENAQSSFIVSGGSSPVQIFKDLSAMEAKWSDINISLVDDRVVDINHEDSNEKLVNDLLIKDKAKDASFISICNQSNKTFWCDAFGYGGGWSFCIIISSANSIKSRIF
jgi:6-phosphogluconolactonase